MYFIYGVFSLSSFSVQQCQKASLAVFLFIYYCVLIWSVYMYILLISCTYHTPLINLRLWYEGTLKYLGESVTGLKSRLRKT